MDFVTIVVLAAVISLIIMALSIVWHCIVSTSTADCIADEETRAGIEMRAHGAITIPNRGQASNLLGDQNRDAFGYNTFNV